MPNRISVGSSQSSTTAAALAALEAPEAAEEPVVVVVVDFDFVVVDVAILRILYTPAQYIFVEEDRKG